MDGGAVTLAADAPTEGVAVEGSELGFDGTGVNRDDEHEEEPPEEEVVRPVKELDGLHGEGGNEGHLEIGTEKVVLQPGEESQVISLEDPSEEQWEEGVDGITSSGSRSESILVEVTSSHPAPSASSPSGFEILESSALPSQSPVFGSSARQEASAVAEGHVLPGSGAGIAVDSLEAKDGLKDPVEVEVFEDALELPQRGQTNDLSGRGNLTGVENGDLRIDGEEFDVQMDGEVIDTSPEDSEIGSMEKLESLVEDRVKEQSVQEQDELELKSIDSHNSEDSGSFKEAQEGKVLDELDGTLEDPNGNLKNETVPPQIHGLETNGLAEDGIQDIDSSSNIVSDGELTVGEHPATGIINGKKLDDLHVIDRKGQENGDVKEQILDDIRINHDIGFEEICDEEIVEEVTNEQRDDLYGVLVQSGEEPQIISLIGGSKDHSENSLDKISSSGSKPEVVMQSDNESVLVEDLYYSSSSDDDDKVTSSQPAPSVPSNTGGSGGPASPSQPAGLGSSARLLDLSARPVQQPRAHGSALQRQTQPSEEPANEDAEDNNETREKLQAIRVKFLRLAHRLGQTPHNVVVAQVLYRLGLAEQLRRNTSRPGVFSFDRASVLAEQLEATGHEPLDFSCSIMVIGKTGVGKSATINSIFDEVTLQTNAFLSATRKVQEVVGTVQGIKVRAIDTPGLSSSSYDQGRNEKILHSVKRFISKNPPDIVLYFDRLDMQTRDYGDIPLLRTITDIFGPSILFNAIIVLTHAASPPPDDKNGNPLSYEMFVTQRTHVVQQAIRQAAGDVRLMNPLSLVENHSACRMNRAGQRVLPNGQVWKPQLLLLSFASKILAEANTLLRLQDTAPSKPFGRTRAPPLPFLLSSLLQSRPLVKLPEEQFGDDDSFEEDLDQASDSDAGSDYDELPPFKRLTKSQMANLHGTQKKAYFEELDYREKLFYKRQLKEERKQRKLMKKIAAEGNNLPSDYGSATIEDEGSGPPSVPVPMPDFVLPSSFDSDYPSHRYRCLDSSSQWLVRPVLETQGWDHDVGYEGLNAERLFVIKEKVPVSVSGQLTKDKKELNLQTEVASSIKHAEGKTTSLGLELQSAGKDMVYTVRGETRIQNFRCNNTASGFSATLLGDSLLTGLKIEDKLAISNQLRMLISGGAMSGRGDVAYGGRLELTLRDKDYPIGRMLSTLALSVVDWRGDLAVGCNVQSQFPVGRATNLIGHANISNKGTGQIGIRLNSSDQLQIALIALVPLIRNIKRLLFSSSESV